jgi:P-type Ca2+ transporter type 2C
VDLPLLLQVSAFVTPFDFLELILLFFLVVLIAGIVSINEYKKQSQFRYFKGYAKSLRKARVTRDGIVYQVSVDELLVGDIVSLSSGDMVPADGLLVQSCHLEVDESTITGEPVRIRKSLEGDPFLLSGTKIVEGVSKMVVLATGPNSVNGKIVKASYLATEETCLQKKLDHLVHQMETVGLTLALLMVIALIILLFTIDPEISRSGSKLMNDLIKLIVIGIKLIVVAVPEGLPLAVTMAISFTTHKMLEDKNLIRHLNACETMGKVTTVCSDKTGTLTENEMTVIVGYLCCLPFGGLPSADSSTYSVNSYDDLTEMIPAAVTRHISRGINVNSTANEIKTSSGKIQFVGCTTEMPLLEFTKNALKSSYKQDRKETFVSDMIPLSSDRKRMSALVPMSPQDAELNSILFEGLEDEALDGMDHWLFCKGAAFLVFKSCDRYVNSSGKVRV